MWIGGILPLTPNPGSRSERPAALPGCFNSNERAPGAYCTGRSVGSRAPLNALEKISPVPAGNRTTTPWSPACSQLRYPGYKYEWCCKIQLIWYTSCNETTKYLAAYVIKRTTKHTYGLRCNNRIMSKHWTFSFSIQWRCINWRRYKWKGMGSNKCHSNCWRRVTKYGTVWFLFFVLKGLAKGKNINQVRLIAMAQLRTKILQNETNAAY